MAPYAQVSTGINGLDEILNYLQMGDNVVLQVDNIEDYKKFVDPYVEAALARRQRLVYMRFANHPALLSASPNIKVYKLNANQGFESFSTEVHNIVRDEGRDVFYVFDCLSDLLLAWATDLMIGNFFVITCPYLFELNTVAYFAILRSRHSFKTVARIRETTQVLLDVYNNSGKICVHPLIDKTLLLTVRSMEALFSRVKGNFYRKTGATIEFSMVCGLAAVLFEQSTLFLDDLPVRKAF